MTKKIAPWIGFLVLFCASIDAADRFAYITSGFSAIPLNLQTNILDTPIPLEEEAFEIAITPDGLTALITCPFAHKIIPIDLTTNTVEPPISIETNKPSLNNVSTSLIQNNRYELAQVASVFALAIAPNGEKAYCTNFDGTLLVIDLASRMIEDAIPVGGIPFGVAISPNGRYAYVVNIFTDSVIPIDLFTKNPGSPIAVGNEPSDIAITPDGKFAFVTNSKSNNITRISLLSNTPKGTIPVGSSPNSIAIASDGKFAYVGNQGSNSITPIDIELNIALQPITGGINPSGIALNPDNLHAYVAEELGKSITIIDLLTKSTTTKDLDRGALRVAVVPDQAPTASFNFSSILFGSVSFDASASHTPIGTIAKYDWDFGDGTTDSTEEPTIMHEFPSPGFYDVTLTVTNSAGTSTKQIFTGQTMTNNGGSSAELSKPVNVTFNILDKI